MKPPLPAVLYGTGLISAFVAGWFLKSTAHPEITLAQAAHPAQPPGVRTPPKSAHPLAASGASWLDAASADLAPVRAAMQPGVVNQVLIAKLNIVLELSDEHQRAARFQHLLTAVRPEDALALRKLFHDLREDGRWFDKEFAAFTVQWGRIAGPHAAILSSGSGIERNMEFYGVISGWGEQDAAAAFDWLLLQKSPDIGFSVAWSGLFQGIASVHPEKAEALLVSNSNDPRFTPYLGTLVKVRISQAGLKGGQALVEQIARGNVPDNYKAANFEVLAEAIEHNIQRGIGEETDRVDFAQKFIGAAWLPKRAGELLGTEWARQDPAAGISAIAKMLSPGAQAAAASSLTTDWASSDPTSLSVWLAENRTHPLFDQAAFHLARTIRKTDPEAAQAWDDQIKEPTFKTKLNDSERDNPFATGE